ncbi:outer membrane beta-barrel family protein [Parapedobacter koreensis]|uniref:outer membrane beta-barrel family protein n=1 Tax=Parapedobacter koreensis TaxID=332977 RepID=UPI001FE0897C|nr:outer membrane beta-barrel family protein [Parapedobacter koreensis]
MEIIAQVKNAAISAVVIDSSSNEPVGFASAALLRQESMSYVKGMQTVDDGKIQFTDVAPGTYAVRITYIGYEDYLRSGIIVQAGRDINLGNISLKPSGELLEEVVVQGTPPAMELGIDRKIFNVAQSTISVGGTASDLLANVPSLQVDVDGSVSLRGSSSVRVLIDGRESAMAGSDITQLLQAMPANSIERIEVVTNPSSRYDAEGQSGIINIVLKKEARGGFNGGVNASAGSYDNYNAGFNLNLRNEKFNYFGNYNFNRRNNVGDGLNSTRQFSNNSLTENSSESNHLGLNHSVRLGTDYYVTDKTLIGFSGNLSLRGNARNDDMFYSYFGHPELSGTSSRFSRQDEDDIGFDLNFDLKHEFVREGEEIVANVAFGRDSEEGVNVFDQTFTDPSAVQDLRVNNTSEDGRNLNLQLDYVRPFGEDNKLEAGYRSIIRRSDDTQRSEYLDSGAGEMLPDYAISNDFNMESIVHALYTNYQRKLTEQFGIQVGLRAEQAYLNTEYLSFDPDIAPTDRSATGRLDYFRIYPSIFLTQEFGEGNQLQASYTRRVSRPRGWQVNPFIDVSDPMNIQQGNPNLLPEDIHSFELSYAKFWDAVMLTTSAYYRRVNDVVQPIITTVEGMDGVTFSQWQNISRNEAAGLELISKVDFSKKVDAMFNANLFHTRFHGSEAFNIDPTEGFNWNANVTANYRIMSSLSAQARAEYQAPRVMAQGKGIEQFVVNAGVRWDVLDRKASILFNVRDLFNQRRWGGYTQTQQFYRYFENRGMRRMFMVTLNYRFGRQDFEREERRNNGMEDDFNGGGEQF